MCGLCIGDNTNPERMVDDTSGVCIVGNTFLVQGGCACIGEAGINTGMKTTYQPNRYTQSLRPIEVLRMVIEHDAEYSMPTPDDAVLIRESLFDVWLPAFHSASNLALALTALSGDPNEKFSAICRQYLDVLEEVRNAVA